MRDEYILGEEARALAINCLAAAKCDTVAHLNNTQKAIAALQGLEKINAEAKEAE